MNKSQGYYLSSDEVLTDSLFKFFKKKENIDKLLPILTRTSKVSLRLLDYFCVNYSKVNQVSYLVSDKPFDVFSSYKNQLSIFSKKKFDPFRRNKRVPLFYNNKEYSTTIAQLSFFKWCITYNLIDYVEKFKNEINKDMKNNSYKANPRKRKSSNKKSNFTAVATRIYNKNGQNVIIMSFE